MTSQAATAACIRFSLHLAAQVCPKHNRVLFDCTSVLQNSFSDYLLHMNPFMLHDEKFRFPYSIFIFPCEIFKLKLKKVLF